MPRVFVLTCVLVLGALLAPAQCQTGQYLYLPVYDDAELGEILLFDIVSQAFDVPLVEVLDIHNEFDLYPEEAAMVLFFAREKRKDIDDVAELRSERRYSWKHIADRLDVDPEALGQSSRWYKRDDKDEWWRDDPVVEREIMMGMLAGAFGVDQRTLWEWAGQGLGYSDMAMALEFERRSGSVADDILYTKVNRQSRWDEVAQELGIDIEDLFIKRSLHYHDRDFQPYVTGDRKRYHPNRQDRDHYSRREYHRYDPWYDDDDDRVIVVYDYDDDYDRYYWYGRSPYSYWYPDSFCYGTTWGWPPRYSSRYDPYPHRGGYHPVHRPWDYTRPVYGPSPGGRLPSSPTVPQTRDSRSYAEKLMDGGSRSVAVRPVSSQPRTVGGATTRPSASPTPRQSSRDRQRDAEERERRARSGSSQPRVSNSPSPRPSSRPSSPPPSARPSSPPSGGRSNPSPSPPSGGGGGGARKGGRR